MQKVVGSGLARHADELPARQEDGGQPAAIHRSGVQSDPPWSHQGFREHGVPEHYWLAEIVGRSQELLPCPQAPLLRLLAQMRSGLKAGMHIDGVAVLPEQGQAGEESTVFRRYPAGDLVGIRCWLQGITGQGLPPPNLKKQRPVATGQVLEKQEVVITHKRYNVCPRFQQGEHSFHYRFGIRSTVHVIAEEDQRVGPVGNLGQQVDKHIVAAVNVADHARCWFMGHHHHLTEIFS